MPFLRVTLTLLIISWSLAQHRLFLLKHAIFRIFKPLVRINKLVIFGVLNQQRLRLDARVAVLLLHGRAALPLLTLASAHDWLRHVLVGVAAGFPLY